ncbi:class I SAM-dependent methyltransferase [Hydrotalea sp.]|uniref:class I SAM-dependent methyltransferase n=1 Tax=Hydrotalea sp. TaxID=2881279 RepID=UPI00262DD82F|nr:class I SAM-dependent methyltransferase [Hydrotalea sp.]
MITNFWDQRYAEHESVYGLEPNQFFKTFIDNNKPGTILLPAEGEGRNALYAAQQGWTVDAFDYSAVAKEKALQRATTLGLNIHYDVKDIASFVPEKQYDAVALIYVHLPELLRKNFHANMIAALKPGGYLVIEAFSKDQIHHQSGGPTDPNLLYDAPTLCSDFQLLHIINCGQKEVLLSEGKFHSGYADVLRLIAQKW